MNRRVPNGTHGGVRGRKSPLETFSYSIAPKAGCHKLYRLRIAPCFALSQSYRYSRFRRVSHGFTLIPVAFEIAYSLLHALRV